MAKAISVKKAAKKDAREAIKVAVIFWGMASSRAMKVAPVAGR